jgi:two-component system invasion response regulator UvrY
MIKIALIDDHVVLRKSLAMLIEMLGHFKVVMEASNGEEFTRLMDIATPEILPDIALMDITMPIMDGVETTKWLKQNYPKVKVIAFSMMNNDLVIIRMLKNGARGYILKDCETVELQTALLEVYNNGYYYNDIVTSKLQSQLNRNNEQKVMFNEKELTFLRFACTEKSYKEIADDMSLSPRTIDGYRDALFSKLKVSSRVGLVVYAFKNNIVSV